MSSSASRSNPTRSSAPSSGTAGTCGGAAFRHLEVGPDGSPHGGWSIETTRATSQYPCIVFDDEVDRAGLSLAGPGEHTTECMGRLVVDVNDGTVLRHQCGAARKRSGRG